MLRVNKKSSWLLLALCHGCLERFFVGEKVVWLRGTRKSKIFHRSCYVDGKGRKHGILINISKSEGW